MLHETIYLHENRKDVTLTTYVLNHSNVFLSGLRRPAVLVCPGGAYAVCSETEGEPVATAFNGMGYHAFVLKYSTYMEGELGFPVPGQEMAPKAHCQFPNPMLDIRCAMQYIQEHADLWNVDPEKIILCGFSAGAHNCGMYSVYWNEYQMPRPAAAILGYALGDYRLQTQEEVSPFIEELKKICNIAISGKPTMSEEELSRLSIIDHVNEHTPPMFLWNTADDEQVPGVQSVRIANALAAHHIPFELHVFESGPHGLSTASAASALMESQIRPDIGVWVDLAHTWLKKRFPLDLPDKMPF